MKPLIILPTYNEKDNLPVVIIKILDKEDFDILIVDDSSTDGTAEIARHWAGNYERVHLMERPGKLGLGTAYIAGFGWGLSRDYDCFIEMDSDLSHDALVLPAFLEHMEDGADLVIGSRYLDGNISVVGWDFKRLLLSSLGNTYASGILGTGLSDMTSGFRAFSRKALTTIDLGSIRSEGYAFQIEMAYNAWQKGLDVRELTIVFTERVQGESKMSGKIIGEALTLVWLLRLRSLRWGISKLISSGSGA